MIVAGQHVHIAMGRPAGEGQKIDAAKPAVLMLHGAGLDHSVWTLPARYLAHHDRSVIAPDLPGHGCSAGAPLTSINALADWAWQLLDTLGIAKAVLVGHSMGALTALHMAARRPDRSRHLFLIGAAAEMPVQADLLQAAHDDQHLADALIAMWGFGPAGRIGGNVMAGVQMRLAGQALLDWAKPGVLAADLTACAAYRDGIADAGQVRCATTLLLGAADRMTPAGKGQQLADLMTQVPGGVRLNILAGCGHMIMAERPNETIDLLRAV